MAGTPARTIERFAVPRRGAADALNALNAPSGTSPASLAEDSIGRSVRAVERAVENFAALRESCDYFKGLAVELRGAFDDEKEQAKACALQLADAERSRRADQDRAERAEQRLEKAAETIRELERQLAAVNAQTDRLVHTLARLMSSGKPRGNRQDAAADLLAA